MNAAPRPLPICRCPRCGARWVLARPTVDGERGVPLECYACTEPYVLEGGRLVSIRREATPTTLHEMRRERHALAVEAGAVRRRKTGTD